MIYVIAEITLDESTRTEFLDIFGKLVPDVRAEHGCIEYGPAVDVTTGMKGLEAPREDVVTIMEKWDSIEALKAHMKTPHMQKYQQDTKDYVRGKKIRILGPA
jgi:quinol monooxygenase YgiN